MCTDNHVLRVFELVDVAVGGAVLTSNDEAVAFLLSDTFGECCIHHGLACTTGSVNEADTIFQFATVNGETFSPNLVHILCDLINAFIREFANASSARWRERCFSRALTRPLIVLAEGFSLRYTYWTGRSSSREVAAGSFSEYR